MDSLIAEAQELERRYLWREGSEIYGNLLRQNIEETLLRADVQERLGYALYRWARQAETVQEFGERIDEAIKSYQQASKSYGSRDEAAPRARSLRCHAMASYLSSGTSRDASEKKRIVGEAWEATKQALEILARSQYSLEYGRTYNELTAIGTMLANLESEYQSEKRVLLDGFELGERSIRLLSDQFPLELSKSYVITAGWMEFISYTILRDPEEQNRYHQTARTHWERATQLSEETALLNLATGGPELGLGSDESLEALRKAIDYGRGTGDKQLLGGISEGLSLHTSWKALGAEDPDEATRLLKEALGYAEEAKNQYDSVGYASWGPPVLWTGSPYADYYRLLARYETDVEKRRSLLEKSLEAAPDQLKRAIDSGYPYAITTALHVFSNTLTALAMIEKDRKRKMNYLERALEHSNEYNRIVQQLEPFNYYNQGVGHDKIARIKSELAELSDDPERERELLHEAILAKEASLKLSDDAMRWVESSGSAGLITQIALRKFEYGELLARSHNRTNHADLLKNASQAFEEAAKLHEKAGQPSRVAECHWRSAQVYDLLDDNYEAFDNFALASKNYKTAAEKMPQLHGFYEDLATYMSAWSEIERARYHHARQEYRLARADYDKAARLHKSSKPRSYLAQNYSAWAELERGEELSRSERPREAIKAFEKSAVLFTKSRAAIQHELGRIKDPAENQMARRLAGASDLRRDYCNARITLEEAKVLDKKGDHSASSEKFGQAAGALEKIAQSLESEKTREELQLIATLSSAWRLMTKAEAENSPTLYAEAAKLFEEAEQQSPIEKSRMLAIGHSRFCKALEAGTRFVNTQDAIQHQTAIRSLEMAANAYVKAGFKSASEYAKACKLLFDAHEFMSEANLEKDQEKRTKLYLMEEKVLLASATSFAKAQELGKRREVLGLLKKARKDREIAASLSAILRAPAIVSTTSSFSTPAPTLESAVGLERFEHASIQAKLITHRKSLKVGEDLNLEIEIVNAGKGLAQLMKVDELLPEGFELTGKPEMYRLEDHYLNMKGKRLDSLKTEELKFVLKPNVKGNFTLKPRVLYLDESGQYKSHQLEPIEITVKELEAFMEGEILIPSREVPIESSFTLGLDIANLGKVPATLLKIEGTIPNGFQLQEENGLQLDQEGVLDMRSLRLEHLKSHQIRLRLKASQKGTFEFRPRLFFANDQGEYKSYLFPSKTVSVLEIGPPQKPIALEVKAFVSANLPEDFRFETERAREVFLLLVKEFLRDYMSRRFYVDKAGWRSLMDLVKETKIPRSAVYGPAGRSGPVLNELERRGVVEARVFPKERGRGGSVKKVRIAYDNAIVKRIIEQTVMQTK